MLDDVAARDLWDTSCTDWRSRIVEGRSLVPELPLHADQAAKALRIFKRLKVPDLVGKPTYGEVCGQWVFDLVAAIFGSFDPETRRRALREFFLLVPKKNGKSAIGAAIIVTAAIMNKRPEAELLLIAPTKKIADIAFKQARGIIEADDALKTAFECKEHQRTIKRHHINAEIQVKAADADVITGSKATYILVDETHVFSKRANAADTFVEIRGSLASRPDGFLLQITTQSKDTPAGVFKAELGVAREVRDGRLALPLLPVLYELPDELLGEAGDGWRDPSTWPLVNPNLGRSVDAAFLSDELAKAEREGPDKLQLIASQHFNVEVGLRLVADRWGGAEFWASAGDPRLTLEALIERSEVATVGIDGGGLDDLLGLAVVGREKVTRRWLVWAHAYAHPIVLQRRKDIASSLRDFEREGSLTFCEGADDDVVQLADTVARLRDTGLLPAKNAVGFDPNNIATIVEGLAARDIDGDRLRRLIQGAALSPALWGLERKLSDGTLSHDGSALMAWCVSNGKVEARGNGVMMTKQASGRAKIDPVIAMLCAAILMSWNPVASGRSVYETRGALVL